MQAAITYHREQVAHILSMLLNREYQQLKSDEQEVTPSKHPKKIHIFSHSRCLDMHTRHLVFKKRLQSQPQQNKSNHRLGKLTNQLG